MKLRRAPFVVSLFTALAVVSAPAFAFTAHGSSHSSHRSSTHKTRTSKTPRKAKASRSSIPRVHHASVTRSDRCQTCDRDEHGRIVRSEKATEAFKKGTGYPHGRHGYVIDHIVPLACGGTDRPSNMQWQTVAAAKAKDKTERAGCHR